jgi:hypothetical protein
MTAAPVRRCARPLPLLLATVIAIMPSPGEAQLQRGAIRGIARDASGGVLPGAVVTLTSELGAPQETISGVLGEFRFVNLDPGRYDLHATLDGFAAYVRESIIVGVGTTVELPLDLEVAARVESVRVTAATPMLESRRQGNVTNFDQAMLNEIPTARDPWALMQHLPGVTIDRPNVGGSRSATQAAIAARGDDGSNTSWNIDGVTITDPAAAGGSSTYFDFNAFEEVQFTTGGIDPRQQTGALGINIVTKRGTNTWRGLARVYFTNDALQQENLPSSLQRRGLTGNRVNQLAEYGGDAGGPLKRDRVWIWAAAARNDIRQLAFTGYPDDSILNNLSAKTDVQLVTANRASFFFHRAEKLVTGRFAGVTRPPETTQNQEGPVSIYKVEDAHVFGSSLFMSGKVAYVDEVFALMPQGGPTAQAFLDQATQIWHGSQMISRSERAIFQTHVDGMVSRGRQEFTFGSVYREGSALERAAWPGDQTVAFINVPGLPATSGLARLTRAGAFAGESDTLGFYAGDTVSVRDWTFNLGLRFDRQQAQNRPSRTAANGLLPERLPSLEYGGGPRLTWSVWSPRLAAAYRIGDRTIARGSYAKFGSQLQWLATVGVENPARLATIEYMFVDANGDHIAQVPELVAPTGFVANVDPVNPATPVSPNQFDPELGPPAIHSLVGGLEHELRPNFSVGMSAGYGRASNQVWQPFIGLTSSDFVEYRTVGQAGDVSSQTPVYRLAPGKTLPPGNGVRVSNRDGYLQRYWNVDLTATKRLSNRWMMRGFVTVQRNREFFDDPSRSIQDPTPRVGSAALPFASGFVDGGLAVPPGDSLINAKVSYSVAGLYEAPWGISVSGTVYGRQGYPVGEVLQVQRPDGLGQAPVLLERDLDTGRYDDLNLIDVRAQKVISWAGLRTTVTIDAFNLLNTNVTLRRIAQAGTTFRNPTELVPPRLVRLGLQLRF